MRPHTAVGLSVVLLAAAIGAAVVDVPGSGGTSTEPPTEYVERVHRAGVTGENVTVGVVSATGFDATHPGLDDRTTGVRSFGDGADGTSDHGTASAALVARLAPDSDLLLAEAGSPRTYRDAVVWLLDRGADVILPPASFVGTAGRSHGIGRLAEREGAVVVAPTGNLARSHWRGEFDPASENGSRIRFRNGTAGSRLRVRGNASEFTVWLSWDDAPATTFEASLYRVRDGGPELVARSVPYADDAVPNQRLSATLGSDRYFLVVRGAEDAVGTTVTVQSPTHELVGGEPRGSITPPASAPSVVAVGAYDQRTNEIARFSGRGPTRRGTLGVDVVAPKRGTVDGSFVGTSAAASYVAGVAALLLDADPSMDAREMEISLERTARPIGPPGPDTVSGYGRVSPVAAVTAVIASGDGQTTTEPMNSSMRSPAAFRTCPS